MGGADESVFQPAWAPDGTLHAVSDRTGWWNVYRRDHGEWVPYREENAEYGVPMLGFGFSTYGFLDDSGIAAVVVRDGVFSLERIDADGTSDAADLPYVAYGGFFGLPRLRTDGRSVYVIGIGTATPEQLVRWTPERDHEVVRRSGETPVDDAYVSTPERLRVAAPDGTGVHALFYPPTNLDATPPADSTPPLIMYVHGGPTGASHGGLDLRIQYFTSRGFAVADVNYRGSSGYGRSYRQAPYKDWGILDVQDCVAVARHLAERERVDGDRMAVRGTSAGGFVALSAFAAVDVFAAGTSQSGVVDLERLAECTHKFESRYLDRLVGPYPEASKRYRDRSPVTNAAEIDAPLLVLQGARDEVVPLSQAEAMGEVLDEENVPHHLEVFEDEGHGFRRSETRRLHELELAFYASVLEIDLADDLPSPNLTASDRS